MTETINLVKGQTVNLSKESNQATKFTVGLGWSANSSNPPDPDIAAYPCMTDENGNPVLISPANKSFVYFGKLISDDGAISHSGDNLTGEGDGDDERIYIDTSKLDPRVDQIIIGIAIYGAAAKNQTFGLINNCYARVYEDQKCKQADASLGSDTTLNPDKILNEAALARYDLQEDAGQFTAFQVGNFYKKDGEWKFRAMGVGASGDLGTFVELLSPGTVITR